MSWAMILPNYPMAQLSRLVNLLLWSGLNDMFVMKTTSSGSLLWIKYFGGSGEDAAKAVTIGPNDEIYAAGYKTAGSLKDGMLVKLDANGVALWTKTFGRSRCR